MSVETKKITMNLSKKTLQDVEDVINLTGGTNRTAIVAKALNAYKSLLEMQESEHLKILTEDKNGNKQRLRLL